MQFRGGQVLKKQGIADRRETEEPFSTIFTTIDAAPSMEVLASY
jgi:hypothetical protein